MFVEGLEVKELELFFHGRDLSKVNIELTGNTQGCKEK